MEHEQYLGEKIALIRIDGISGRKIRSWRSVDVIGLFKYPSEFFCPGCQYVYAYFQKRIYSSRVKLGVPCNILNTLIDISQSVGRWLFLPRVIYFRLYVPSSYSSFSLLYTLLLSSFPDNRRSSLLLFDILISRFVFSITFNPKEFVRILSVNYESSR